MRIPFPFESNESISQREVSDMDKRATFPRTSRFLVFCLISAFVVSACARDKRLGVGEDFVVKQDNGQLTALVDKATKKVLPLTPCKRDCQITTKENRILSIDVVPLPKDELAVILETEKKVGSVVCCLTAAKRTKQTIIEGEGVQIVTNGGQYCCYFKGENACKTTKWRWYTDQYQNGTSAAPATPDHPAQCPPPPSS